MIQISQLFNFQYSEYLELYLLIFVILIFCNLIYLIVAFFRQQDKNLNSTNKLLIFINFFQKKILITGFCILFLCFSILFYFPQLSNIFYNSDNLQKITVKNFSQQNIEFLLTGHLSNSNKWYPIFPQIAILDISPIIKLEKNKNITFKVRSGIKDINYLCLSDITNKKYKNVSNGIIIKLPKNDIVLYSKSLEKKLNKKHDISLNFIYLTLAIYFTGIILSIYFFFSINNKNIKLKIGFISILSIIIVISIYSLFNTMSVLLRL